MRRFLRTLAVTTKSSCEWALIFGFAALIASGTCWVLNGLLGIPYHFTAPAFLAPVALFVFLFPMVGFFDEGWRVLHFVSGFWFIGLVCGIGRYLLHVDSAFLMGFAGGILGLIGLPIYFAVTDQDDSFIHDSDEVLKFGILWLLLIVVGVLCGLSTFNVSTYSSEWILGGIVGIAILGAYTGFIHAPKIEEPQPALKLNEMVSLNDLSQSQLQSILDMVRQQPDSSQRRSLENEISRALESNRRRR